MNTISGHSLPSFGHNDQALATNLTPAFGTPAESPSERVERLYKEKGDPLVAWLFDEGRLRGLEVSELARELNVTTGYLNQLRSGARKTEDLSHVMCESCARFLSVPPIAVKVVAGVIRLGDFLHPAESEEEAVERAIRHIQADPIIRQAIPVDLSALSLEAKKVVVLMYTETASQDVLGLKELPSIIHWLRGAALAHADRLYECRDSDGHLDTAAR